MKTEFEEQIQGKIDEICTSNFHVLNLAIDCKLISVKKTTTTLWQLQIKFSTLLEVTPLTAGVSR